MGEEEKLCVLATGPKASGKLWTDKESNSAQKLSEQSKILGLVLADGEKVEGVHFMQNKAFLLWTESGNIYRVDLGENKYHKIGRPGRIHMVCSDGCDRGFAAVLAGAGQGFSTLRLGLARYAGGWWRKRRSRGWHWMATPCQCGATPGWVSGRLLGVKVHDSWPGCLLPPVLLECGSSKNCRSRWQ